MRFARICLVLVFSFVLLLALNATPAEAQILKRLKERAQEKIEDKILEKEDEVLEEVLEGGGDSEEAAEESESNSEEAEEDAPAAKAAPKAAAKAAPNAGPNPEDLAAGQLKPGQGAWSNYDFVPGERILFAEDFTKDRVGNFPQRMELLTGNAEVVDWHGRRWLRVNDYSAIKIPLPENLPQRFTVEFELFVPWTRMGFHSEPQETFEGTQYLPGNYKTSAVLFSGTEAGVYRGGDKGQSVVDPRDLFFNMYSDEEGAPRLSTTPIKVRMQVDGKYIKVYMNEKRVSNMPNGNFGRQNYLVFEFDQNGEEKDAPLITDFSINAGGTPMYDALMSNGRFATQGILFDTGSDRIRPESTPTLKDIGDMLKQHGDLRILIEGHTDNVGKADANQTLSDKRAAAVRAYLMQTYGIEASRLEAKGFGASKPATTNDTPEGRQQNRRVELVKL